MRTKALPLLIVLATLASAAFGQSGQSRQSGQPFRGELTARYRDRWGDSRWEDEDALTYLRLSYGEEGERGFAGALSLRWNADLLDRGNEIDDGKDDLRVYYAYLDVNKIDRFDLRLGRQYVDEAEGFPIDGIKGVYRAPWKQLRVGLFAGQPLSFYSDLGGGERAGGLTWSLRPRQAAQLRGSWIHLDEERAEGDVVTLSYRQRIGDGANVFVTARTLDFEVFNELLGGSWRIKPGGPLLTGSYRRQEDINASRSRYFGDLSTIIGPSRPFQQLTINVSQPLRELASVGLGYTRRELLDEVENAGNHEFGRLFVDLALTERALAGMTASANFSRWQSDDGDSTTLGGALGRRFGEHLRLEAGNLYSKYDLERFFDRRDELPRERFDVRSTYLRGDWRVRHRYRLRLELARTTDSQTPDPYYEAELRFGLDLGFLDRVGER